MTAEGMTESSLPKETPPRKPVTEREIRKAWQKEMEHEMMWWLGIHLLQNEHAKYSWKIRE